jgi:RHS repeat-associated protein
MKRVVFLTLLTFLTFSRVRLARAQDPDDLQQGIKAYGTYRGGDIDSVSMTNGNLTLNIPLISYPQRGHAHLGYELVYNNKNYKQTTTCQGDICTTYVRLRSLASPLRAISDRSFSIGAPEFIQVPGTNLGFNSYSLTASDGATHQLAALSSSGSGYETVDGTGLFYNTSTNTTLDADGAKYGESNMLEDTNGNQITIASGGTDTVGRSLPTGLGGGIGLSNGAGSCPSGPLPVHGNTVWSAPGPNGGTSTFLFCYAQVSVVGTYDVTDGTNYYENINFLQSVVLPNGTAWTFQYSNDGAGDLTQITFPTGGTISYVWEGLDSCTGMLIPPRWLASRTVNANDGTGSHKWTYTYGSNSNHQPTTTVADPLGNNTVYTNSFLSWCSAYTTQVQYYQGSSSLLKTVSTTFSSSASPFNTSLTASKINIVPTQITTEWANGKTSQVTKTYDTGFTFPSPRPDGPSTYTGIYGKVTAQKEYDYGTTSGVPGPLLRQTNTGYVWQSPNPNYSSYLGNNMLNLVYSTQITDGTNQKAYTQYGYDETATIASGLGTAQNLDTSVWTAPYRGNQTSVNRWRNLPTAKTLTSKTTYYDTGMPSVAKDPLLNPTTYFYSGTFQDAYVTQIENALSQSIYYNYDYDTGLLTSTTDLNSQVTTDSYDSSWRLTNVTRPTAGGQTSFCYTDLFSSNCTNGTAAFQVIVTKQITSSLNEISIGSVDGLGRLFEAELYSDPDGPTSTVTTYDPLGRKSEVYNPTRCSTPTTNCGTETTWGYSTYNYDGIGRVTSLVEQDSSTVGTNYASFPCTLVTDEAGKSRTSCEDGLGRMTGVWEDPSGLDYETDYQYDTLGNLLLVTQKGSNVSQKRVRTFTYDSLSRLLSASNPETGTVATAYTYDDNGNVLTKQALSPNQPSTGTATVTTAYTYDQLNRLATKGYSDTYGSNPSTAGVVYGYDAVAPTGCTTTPPADADSYPVGHRTAMCDGSGATSWKHDQIGRTLEERRTIGTVVGDYNTDTYNLDGSVATVTTLGYGVSYAYGGAARPLSATNSSVNFAQSATYAPLGELAGMTMGSATGFTGFVASNAYNPRLQPILLSAGVSGHNPVFSVCYDFHLHVAVTAPSPCSFSSSSGDNGNVYQLVNNRDSTRTQNFIYDSLNRIQQGYSSGTQWGETFGPTATSPGTPPSTAGIDSWGNLTNRSGVTGKTNTEGLSVTAGTNNQLSGFNYDAPGNMILNGSASYFYDAENRLIATAGYSYVYDGDGQRVKKCTEGTTPGTCSSSATGTLYWKGMGSAPLTETDLAGSVQNVYVFFNGQRIARSDNGGAIHYYFSDQLGSHGVVENATATTCEQDIDYYPYGGVENDYCSNVAQHYKFTGKERDSESGLDNFGARYNASTMGRFMTPDPIHIMKQKFLDPQQWNMYAYVRNNPLRFVDPTGKYLVNCGDGDKKCNKAADKFEKQREKDLKSKDLKVQDAAKAWGNRGEDNHVNVTFKPQAQVDADAHTAPGYTTQAFVRPGAGADHQPNIQAEFSESLGGSSLGQVIAHEGSHIEDDMSFLNSYNGATGKYNPGLNFTHFDTEFQAFEAGSGVKSYSEFQRGPRGYQQLDDYIYRAYPNADDLVFPPAVFPQ